MFLGSTVFGDTGFGGEDLDTNTPIEALTVDVDVETVLPNEAIEVLTALVNVAGVLPNEAIEVLTALVAVEAQPPYELVLSPEVVFPGYSSDGTNITIPIASIPGLSVAEADEVTGDLREIAQAILLTFYEYFENYSVIRAPKTMRIYQLTNWNANDPNLGRGVKRHVRAMFAVNHAIPKVTGE